MTVALLLALLPACGPGTLHHSEGNEPLYTAWWREMPTREDRLELVVSNGHLPCAAEDWTREDLAADLATSVCREGARHLWLQLQGSQAPWTGEAGDLLASSYAVLEAELQEADGLERSFSVTEDELVASASTDGRVTERRRDDVWVVQVDLPAIDTSARIRAQTCVDDAVYDAMGALFAADGCP